MKSENAIVNSNPEAPHLASRLPESANGSPSPASFRQSPNKSRWSGRRKILVVGGLLCTVAAIVVISMVVARDKGGAHPELVKHKVQYGRLELTIVERGALESANNGDVSCKVKTASIKPPNIKTVIDDGTAVLANRPLSEIRTIYVWDEEAGKYQSLPGPDPKGKVVVEVIDPATGAKHYADLLLDLEDSALQDQLADRKTALDQADLDFVGAKKSLEDARLALMKYTGLTRDQVMDPKSIAGLKADLVKLNSNIGQDPVKLAEEDLIKYKSGDYLALVKDALGQIENSKSDVSQQEDREAWAYRMAKKGYQTQSQAQAETLRKESYQLTLNKASLNLENIVKTGKLKDMDNFISTVEQAVKTLDIKKAIFNRALAHYNDSREEIKKCKLSAPQDGLVVYYVPEQARMGVGASQSIIAQGEAVREGQKLMQIPDLKHMIVNTKVHEAMVRHVSKGQQALIRVDSFSGHTLHGKVESVANVPAQADFMSADVKVYLTKVAISAKDIEELAQSESGQHLKPGMSAEVTITIEDALEQVLTVPIQAIFGGSEMEEKRSVMVMTPDGPQKRDVVVGLSNDKIAEIKKGLQEGDEVIENPKAVLGDKIKVREPGAEKQSGGSEFGGKGGKGGGKDKGGPPKAKSKD